MDLPKNNKSSNNKQVDLQSLVESHDKPFVVIDSNYVIVAANDAYRERFCRSGEDIIGKTCYQVSHHRDEPCHEYGEECPYNDLFKEDRQVSCLHIHQDSSCHKCQVRVSSYPVMTASGELLMGELIEALSNVDEVPAERHTMVGNSKAFLQTLDQLNRVAKTDATILLQGETGTGKELAAHYIHANSSRARQPFVVMDCTVLPENLFESEVFGHERGAFTGSVGERAGLFEHANGGTLFMDEVGELPLGLQPKLLRALETGKYRRVGSNKTREADVRVICATNRDLQQQVASGGFREDLYYRIACLSVLLPPLRERLDDVEVLAPTLLKQICRALGNEYRLTNGALDWLKNHDYPGNIRELRNLLLVAATQSTRNTIYADNINAAFTQQKEADKNEGKNNRKTAGISVTGDSAPVMDADSLPELEAQYIAGLLKKYANNRKRVASIMGISERTLYRKIKRYSLA